MRKIEIDEKNMIAIVEPYAIGAVIQAEAMKYGLNLNIPGWAAAVPVVASTSSWVGFGPTSISMGCARVKTCLELMGASKWRYFEDALSAGSGWFCGRRART